MNELLEYHELFEDYVIKYGAKILSKPNVTQLNSTKATQKQLRWVRHSTHLEPTHTTPPTPHHPTPPQTFQALLDQLES